MSQEIGLRRCRLGGVRRTPVGAVDSVERLRGECDIVFCPETPSGFSAAGSYYEVFHQVSDVEAMSYLE